jgi:transitional endoplasmic reticulum ATPase
MSKDDVTTEMQPSITLRVAEAQAKDAGRGIARLDPADLERLGVSIGDVIRIKGEKLAVARAMPAYLPERGKGIIQIDGIARENTGSGLDVSVTVQRCDYQLARTVTLTPLSGGRKPHGRGHAQYIGRLLEGRPLIAGDRVRVDLVGTGALDYRVSGVSPQGVVMVGEGTKINLQSEGTEEHQPVGFTYEDIGGLHREIQRIREMIELPLKYPEVFERLGIDPPKGVLLNGPPGCGKTLIARAVANETNAHFISIAGPEVIHKFYGESEKHLRDIFKEAEKHAPSIIFLDEIDAIAPKREETSGDKQVEKRVVAQLLSLMDGLKGRGNVIVIGATNIPNTLDPALRRPGRFDREITIGIPDQRGRLEILEIHSRGMPLAEDVTLERVAAITHGFVGADLEALCREAAMTALRGIMPTIDFAAAQIPYEKLYALEVTMDHFLGALAEVEPSAIREVFTEIPNVGWDDVGGLDDVKEALRESIEWPLKYADLFTQAGTRPPKGILLSGPPGVGKTLLAKAVASQSEANFISIKGPALLNKYVGESERGVREIFRKAKLAHPCIIFFDEIDALAPRRGSGSSDVTDRVLSQLLTELDGIEALKEVVVIAATNRPDILDPALLRAGRFDQIFEFPAPDLAARQEIFAVHTRNKPLADDVDLAKMAASSSGMSGADIESVCQRAAMNAIREVLNRPLSPPETPPGADLKITAQHFAHAMTRGATA